ncbi:MAG: type II secretion system GspH family protein [Lachnospiraceae bacterium]|nr:type II secretion system GspH family protein [Lachnospiraceae bacterium]
MKGKHNRGMTMVEILVAFVILVIVMSILYGCIRFASNLMMEATDTDRSNELFQKAVTDKFKDVSDYDLGSSGTVVYNFKDASNPGASYDFSVSTAKVMFKETVAGYEETTDNTAQGVRSLYIFSTGD